MSQQAATPPVEAATDDKRLEDLTLVAHYEAKIQQQEEQEHQLQQHLKERDSVHMSEKVAMQLNFKRVMQQQEQAHRERVQELESKMSEGREYIESLKQDNMKRKKEMIVEMKRMNKETVARLTAEHEASINILTQQFESELEAKQQEIDELQAKHDSRVTELEIELEVQTAEHRRKTEALVEEKEHQLEHHQQAVDQINKQHAADVQKQTQCAVQQKHEQLLRHHDEMIQNLKSSLQQEKAELETSHQQQLRALQQKHAAELDKTRTQLEQSKERVLALQAKNEQLLNQAKAENGKDVAELEAQLRKVEDDAERTVAELIQDHKTFVEFKLKEQKEVHELEKSKLAQSHSQVLKDSALAFKAKISKLEARCSEVVEEQTKLLKARDELEHTNKSLGKTLQQEKAKSARQLAYLEKEHSAALRTSESKAAVMLETSVRKAKTEAQANSDNATTSAEVSKMQRLLNVKTQQLSLALRALVVVTLLLVAGGATAVVHWNSSQVPSIESYTDSAAEQLDEEVEASPFSRRTRSSLESPRPEPASATASFVDSAVPTEHAPQAFTWTDGETDAMEHSSTGAEEQQAVEQQKEEMAASAFAAADDADVAASDAPDADVDAEATDSEVTEQGARGELRPEELEEETLSLAAPEDEVQQQLTEESWPPLAVPEDEISPAVAEPKPEVVEDTGAHAADEGSSSVVAADAAAANLAVKLDSHRQSHIVTLAPLVGSSQVSLQPAAPGLIPPDLATEQFSSGPVTSQGIGRRNDLNVEAAAAAAALPAGASPSLIKIPDEAVTLPNSETVLPTGTVSLINLNIEAATALPTGAASINIPDQAAILPNSETALPTGAVSLANLHAEPAAVAAGASPGSIKIPDQTAALPNSQTALPTGTVSLAGPYRTSRAPELPALAAAPRSSGSSAVPSGPVSMVNTNPAPASALTGPGNVAPMAAAGFAVKPPQPGKQGVDATAATVQIGKRRRGLLRLGWAWLRRAAVRFVQVPLLASLVAFLTWNRAPIKLHEDSIFAIDSDAQALHTQPAPALEQQAGLEPWDHVADSNAQALDTQHAAVHDLPTVNQEWWA